MNKYNITIIIGVVLVVAAFFGGKAYGAHSTSSANSAARSSFAGRTAFSGTRLNGAGGQGTIGTVISKDANSITVSIPNNGGSKIILYSPSTTVMKSTAGSISDVAVGAAITATGTSNSDGSVTATSIQIRPAFAQGSGTAQPAGNLLKEGTNPGGPMMPATTSAQ